MKLKTLYPIVVILLLILLSSIALSLYSFISKFIILGIIVSSIGLVSLLLGLFIATIIIKKSKQSVGNVAKTMFQSWMIFILTLLNIIAFMFILNYLYIRIDMTEGKKYSISKPTVDLIRKIDNLMIIEYYYNDKCKEQTNQAQIVQYILDILKEYENASKGMIDFRPTELNYNKHRGLIEDLKQKGVKEFPLTDNKEDESKILRGISAIILKYQDKETVIPVIQHDVGFEYVLDTEIRKIVTKEGDGIGIIFAFSGKSYENDFKYAKQLIESEYKDVRMINPGQNIPKNISTLLIIGGNELSDYDMFQIDQFLLNGGKAFVLINGINTIINPQYGIFGFPNDDKLIDMFAGYGLKINRDLVGDNESYNPLPQAQQGFMIEYRYPIWPRIKEENMDQKNPTIMGLKTLNFFWPSSIDIDEKIKNNTTVLFHTTKDSWSQKENYKLDVETYRYPIQTGEKEYNLGCAFEGEITSYFAGKDIPKNEKGDEQFTGKRLDKGKTRLIIVSNNAFLEKMFFEASLAGQNEYYFFLNCLDWLSKDKTLIAIRNKGQFIRPLDKVKNREQYDNRKAFIIAFSTYIIPIILIIIAIIFNILRYTRNKKIKQLYSKKS